MLSTAMWHICSSNTDQISYDVLMFLVYHPNLQSLPQKQTTQESLELAQQKIATTPEVNVS